MRVLISADMEGATSVTWPGDVEPGTEQWQRCRRMFTSDVNAAIAGFLAAGADEVLVNEAHSTMRNLLLEDLDRRAVMLSRQLAARAVAAKARVRSGSDRVQGQRRSG